MRHDAACFAVARAAPYRPSVLAAISLGPRAPPAGSPTGRDGTPVNEAIGRHSARARDTYMPKLPMKPIVEAQFEAQLRAAILAAFPWLPSSQITHQDSFNFRFGHATITVNAEAKNNARARADVLVRFKGQPLAVFELKRPGVRLTQEDSEQGLSYGRVLHPRPPLVVVSNGRTVHILETETGERWQPETMSETTLETLIERGVQVAQADLKHAVATLMGADSHIWMQAVRHITDDAIAELTGDWDEPLAPFAQDLLLPRKATQVVANYLEGPERLITVEGDPLSGKSSVLRELSQWATPHPTIAILYIDADNGVNLIERISLILAEALDWPVTPDEARQWLVNLSRANGPALVLAVDNLGPDRDDLRRDVETLTSNLFGVGVRVVVAVDSAVADQITMSRNSREKSALGRRAIRLSVGPLDNEEFARARVLMATRRLTFVGGAEHSAELRKPWLLRAITADAVTAPEYKSQNLVAALSPVPGLEILDYARRRFDISQPPFSRCRELAQALLEDAQDTTRAYQLKLETLNTFIVRSEIARRHLDAHELGGMREIGLVREARSQSGDSIYVVRLPELVASELSGLIATDLIRRTQNSPSEAAGWLADVASSLPLGDVVAATALFEAAIANRGLNIEVVAELRKRPPQRKTLAPGALVATFIDGVGIVNMTVREDGDLEVEHNGEEWVVEAENGEANVTFSDVHPYQILSHLAGHAIQVLGTPYDPTPRLDPDLLIGVGGTPTVLRQPNSDPKMGGMLVHHIGADLSIVCHKAGIVEPITWSLVRFLGREDATMRDQFIDAALDSPPPALLARIEIALRQTAKTADRERAVWAESLRRDRLRPMLEKSLASFLHN